MLDEYDVRYWFAENPEECAQEPKAQAILRQCQHEFRPWFRYPSSEEISRIQNPTEKREAQRAREKIRREIAARHDLSWWADLRKEIQKQDVPDSLVDKFADYLAGYVLVWEDEEVRSRRAGGTSYEWVRHGGLVTEPDPNAGKTVKHRLRPRSKRVHLLPEWRKAKRLRQKLGNDLGGRLPAHPTTRAPHKESLKSTLSRLMVEKLGATGKSQASASNLVTSIWELIDEADRDSDPATVARSVRRSRRRGHN
jgi:hypothetical protein